MSPEGPSAGSLDADAAVVNGQAPPSARVPLSRQRVLETAVTFIDEQGLSALTMRSLGAELGVEAMALYRHVPGREELLDGVVQLLVSDLDSQVLRAPAHGWQDFLQRLAHGIRRVALAHPRAFPLVASRPPEAPWLRPPLRSLEWVEVFLQGMLSEGFGEQETVAAYRAFTSFLLGHLLLEVSQAGADIGPLDVMEDPDGSDDDFDRREHPAVSRLQGVLSEDHSAVEFEEALESLLDRLHSLR